MQKIVVIGTGACIIRSIPSNVIATRMQAKVIQPENKEIMLEFMGTSDE